MSTKVEIAPALQALIIAHYERALPLIMESFPRVPFEPSYSPDGLGEKPAFSGAWRGSVPACGHVVEVGDEERRRRYLALEPPTVLWLLERHHAIGLESWTPSPLDPESVGFARICLRPSGGATQDHLAFAMLALRTVLLQTGVEAVPVLNGVDGATLFIPFSDVPTYETVRDWLRGVALDAELRNDTLLTIDSRDHVSRRIHVNVSSNAVGHFSSLPYALMGTPELVMVTPIHWNELGTVSNGQYTASNSAERLALGNVFQACTDAIGAQRFSSAVRGG